ncbi:MAG: Stp1/IreP family PP2C-type Ser/Thr phosphatase [Peptococcaceae bacterium]|nr:Stp1/IreP family PP2C-type Ser/Thr phosphatase [Peptococcaceae bacterium]MDH7524287.1 Stp1/IreP family PP2C-type Ser/Thr phosphatase [Peptococcaceae bacterium]
MLFDALTDVGLIRKENEDNYLVSPERGLFAVADGMGGHVGGQKASKLAVQVLDELINNESEKEAPALMQYAVSRANEMILKSGENEQEYYGMGTTVTAALFRDGLIHLAHIGDSRAYLFRDSSLSLLTCDHSLVNELFQTGSLTFEEMQNHPQRNILTRALGTQKVAQVDIMSLPAQEKDLLLLCTDGLYCHVSDREIEDILKQDWSLKEKVRRMVALALERGGTDNITVVLVANEG